jgi:cell division protein FtsW
MRMSRADRSVLATWWFTVDRKLLTALLSLIGIGLVLSLAASPAVAIKKGLRPYYFVERQLAFTCIGVVAMLGISMLDARSVRRLAALVFAAAVGAMAMVLFTGDEINGAKRWVRIAGLSLQPSEFAKPAFVVLAAWAFAEIERRRDMPGLPIAIGLYVTFAGLLILQPDVGQTMLISLVWGCMFAISGQPMIWAAAFAGLAAAGLVTAYYTLGYVHARVDKFLKPVVGDRSQTDRATQSFIEGGFFGRGPAEGTIKTVLPDAHTDFIFAVVGEEFGAVACLGLVGLFAFIVLRALARVIDEPDPFTRLAVAGLSLVFGLQALINMAVNVGLMPPKGMTLPFISAGGSSTLAIALGMGLVLALTRRRPDVGRLKLPTVTEAFEGGYPGAHELQVPAVVPGNSSFKR